MKGKSPQAFPSPRSSQASKQANKPPQNRNLKYPKEDQTRSHSPSSPSHQLTHESILPTRRYIRCAPVRPSSSSSSNSNSNSNSIQLELQPTTTVPFPRASSLSLSLSMSMSSLSLMIPPPHLPALCDACSTMHAHTPHQRHPAQRGTDSVPDRRMTDGFTYPQTG